MYLLIQPLQTMETILTDGVISNGLRLTAVLPFIRIYTYFQYKLCTFCIIISYTYSYFLQ